MEERAGDSVGFFKGRPQMTCITVHISLARSQSLEGSTSYQGGWDVSRSARIWGATEILLEDFFVVR